MIINVSTVNRNRGSALTLSIENVDQFRPGNVSMSMITFNASK